MVKCEECWVGFDSVSEIERFSLIMNNENFISENNFQSV